VFRAEQHGAPARRICADVNYKETEITMSTLTISLGHIAAPPSTAAAAPAKPGLFARLVRGREMRARREVLSYLASHDDERLAILGFSADDIIELRKGNLRIGVAR
jgi:hypothetical protein